LVLCSLVECVVTGSSRTSTAGPAARWCVCRTLACWGVGARGWSSGCYGGQRGSGAACSPGWRSCFVYSTVRSDSDGIATKPNDTQLHSHGSWPSTSQQHQGPAGSRAWVQRRVAGLVDAPPALPHLQLIAAAAYHPLGPLAFLTARALLQILAGLGQGLHASS
jgi:hypothetical protein